MQFFEANEIFGKGKVTVMSFASYHIRKTSSSLF